MQIYVHRNGQQLGPFSETELQALLKTGSISLQDPVWWEGQAGWVPLAQTPLAAPLIAAVPVAGIPLASMNMGEERTSKLALWSMICGISVFFCGITFIPAIILGHMGLSETKKDPAVKGQGMAIAGLVMGYGVGALYLISVIAISVLIALGNQVKGTFKTIQDQENAQKSGQTFQLDNPSSTNGAPANSSDSSTNTAPVVTP